MAKNLIQKPLSVRRSDIEGYGVFAEKDFAADEVIEECYVLLTDLADPAFDNYFFTTEKYFGLALGYGSLYNHANDPNAGYVYDNKRQVLVISARRPIVCGEEIYISYGEDWFSTRSIRIKKVSWWRKTWRFLTGVPLRGFVILGLIYLLIHFLRNNFHSFVVWFFSN